MENEQHYSFAPVYCVPQADGQGTGCLHILSPAEQYQSQMKNLEIQHFDKKNAENGLIVTLWNVMFGFDVFLLLFFVVKVPLSHWSIVVMAWSLTKVTMLLSPASSSSFLTLIVYRITSPSCRCHVFVIRTIISDDHLHVMAKFIHCHPNHRPVAKPLRRYLWSWWNISELGGRSLPKGALLGEGRRMETTPENRVLIIIVLILSLMIVMRMATMINTGLDNIIMTRSPWILNSAHEAMKEFQNLVWLYQKVSE